MLSPSPSKITDLAIPGASLRPTAPGSTPQNCETRGFKALADGTRVQIVSLLARAGRPMSVGEIVAAVAVGQSTVSAHLKVLAEVRFVLVEQRGTARYYRVNDECVACFPTAADVVMGRSAPARPDGADESPITRTHPITGGLYSAIVQATTPVPASA